MGTGRGFEGKKTTKGILQTDQTESRGYVQEHISYVLLKMKKNI
jgi:hypothetical protein